MVDLQTVCCMCGDVGFPDKLFRCNKCRHRFQHSYCSNYYSENWEAGMEQCDWCVSEERSNPGSRHIANNSARKSIGGSGSGSGSGSGAGPVGSMMIMSNRSEYSGEKIKQPHDNHREEINAAATERGSARNNHSSGVPSPRTATRRYKLLKDVMC